MASDKPTGRILGREDIDRLVAEVKAEIAVGAVAADLREGPETGLGARAQRLREWAAHEGLRHAEAVPDATSEADRLIAMMSSVAFLVTCQVIDQLLADGPTDPDFYWSVVITDGAGRETLARPVPLPTTPRPAAGTATELAEVLLRREVAQAESGAAPQPTRIEVRIWEFEPQAPDQAPFDSAVWEQDRGVQDVLE